MSPPPHPWRQPVTLVKDYFNSIPFLKRLFPPPPMKIQLDPSYSTLTAYETKRPIHHFLPFPPKCPEPNILPLYSYPTSFCSSPSLWRNGGTPGRARQLELTAPDIQIWSWPRGLPVWCLHGLPLTIWVSSSSLTHPKDTWACKLIDLCKLPLRCR